MKFAVLAVFVALAAAVGGLGGGAAVATGRDGRAVSSSPLLAADDGDVPLPNPEVAQPFSDEYLAHVKPLSAAWYHVCIEYNKFRRTVDEEDLLPKDGASPLWIIPHLDIEALASLGDLLPVLLLHYSPSELHENAIGRQHPASAKDEDGIISATWHTVALFAGPLWGKAVKVNAVPVPFPYRGDPTDVFEEKVWKRVEELYNNFLRSMISHDQVRTFLGSKGTKHRVNGAFGGKLKGYHVQNAGKIASASVDDLDVVPHPELLHSKKLREKERFDADTAQYDILFTIFRKMIDGDAAKPCDIGRALRENDPNVAAVQALRDLAFGGKDIVHYLIQQCDNAADFLADFVPKAVKNYGKEHIDAIRKHCGLGESDTVTLKHLHGHMSRRGGEESMKLLRLAQSVFPEEGLSKEMKGEYGRWLDKYDGNKEKMVQMMQNQLESSAEATKLLRLGQALLSRKKLAPDMVELQERLIRKYGSAEELQQKIDGRLASSEMGGEEAAKLLRLAKEFFSKEKLDEEMQAEYERFLGKNNNNVKVLVQKMKNMLESSSAGGVEKARLQYEAGEFMNNAVRGDASLEEAKERLEEESEQLLKVFGVQIKAFETHFAIAMEEIANNSDNVVVVDGKNVVILPRDEEFGTDGDRVRGKASNKYFSDYSGEEFESDWRRLLFRKEGIDLGKYSEGLRMKMDASELDQEANREAQRNPEAEAEYEGEANKDANSSNDEDEWKFMN